jgi:predicted alpha/beta superfamily hydrolase
MQPTASLRSRRLMPTLGGSPRTGLSVARQTVTGKRHRTGGERSIAMSTPHRSALLATEVRSLKSTTTGQNYRISVALPYSYVEPFNIAPYDEPLSAWPVIYLLDSNVYFGMVTDTVRIMAIYGRTTDAIVVGVGYPEEDTVGESFRRYMAGRTHDLTPMHSVKSDDHNSKWLHVDVKTGGGGEFYKFIRQDLIPWVDREYRTDTARRILAGHSHGGLFCLYAMFQEPGLFRNYIASSPSFNFADYAISKLESEYAQEHIELLAQLFVSAGELEEDVDTTDLTDMYRFAAILESRKYEGFALTKQVFPDNDHCEVVAPALQAGLKLARRK